MEKENLYNIHFCVKYKAIEQELLKNHDEKTDYSKQDVQDVCLKLYRDEYASVFYCNHILDDKIDENLRKIYTLFSLNPDFESCILKMVHCMEFENPTIDKDTEKYFCFLSLFSEDLFYLMHPFVCHFLNSDAINKEVFEEIFQEWQKEWQKE